MIWNPWLPMKMNYHWKYKLKFEIHLKLIYFVSNEQNH